MGVGLVQYVYPVLMLFHERLPFLPMLESESLESFWVW